jgi:SAM-dependent methyltransferase
MSTASVAPAELQDIYRNRFEATQAYRADVWRVLTAEFFQRFVAPDATVLDLGCGYGEFINNVAAGRKFAMDLNPDSAGALRSEVTLLAQDCSAVWSLASDSLDLVFTSNFFEHLPDKDALSRTIAEAHRCLRPGGRIIAMGPNIRCVAGAYWDFWDHHLALTHLSLSELLTLRGFRVDRADEAFLPYTLVNARRYPLWMLRCYLRLPVAWKYFGGQFLVVASKAG